MADRERGLRDNCPLCVLDDWGGAAHQGRVAGLDLGQSVCPLRYCFQDAIDSLDNKKGKGMRIEKRGHLTFNAKIGIIKGDRSLRWQ